MLTTPSKQDQLLLDRLLEALQADGVPDPVEWIRQQARTSPERS